MMNAGKKNTPKPTRPKADNAVHTVREREEIVPMEKRVRQAPTARRDEILLKRRPVRDSVNVLARGKWLGTRGQGPVVSDRTLSSRCPSKNYELQRLVIDFALPLIPDP